MTWACTETTAPSEEPVSLPEIKAHCYVTIDDDDVLLASYLTTARQIVSEWTGRATVNATYTWLLSDWPSGALKVPYSPLSSVTTVKYYNTDNTLTTIGSSNYIVTTGVVPGQVEWVSSYSVPALRDRDWPIEVVFVAGYGTTAASVPGPLKHAIKMLAAHWYANRESVVVGAGATELPLGVQALLAPYGLNGFGRG